MGRGGEGNGRVGERRRREGGKGREGGRERGARKRCEAYRPAR